MAELAAVMVVLVLGVPVIIEFADWVCGWIADLYNAIFG